MFMFNEDAVHIEEGAEELKNETTPESIIEALEHFLQEHAEFAPQKEELLQLLVQ